jgi:hypothetical protein
MSRYAKGTTVETDRSVGEIKNTLRRFGADGFQITEDRKSSSVAFKYKNRTLLMCIDLPDGSADVFQKSPGRGKQRSSEAAYKEWEKECRRRWRGLALVIKAMLVAVAEGIVKFDEAFLPYMVGVSGRTIGQMMAPKIDAALAGHLPKGIFGLLPDKTG